MRLFKVIKTIQLRKHLRAQVVREDARQVSWRLSWKEECPIEDRTVELMVGVMRCGCLRLVCLRRVAQHFYDCAHPGMNTTLEPVCSNRELGTPGSRPFLGTTRGDENYRAEVQALGRGNRIAGDAV